jgi:hypothetical protein
MKRKNGFLEYQAPRVDDKMYLHKHLKKKEYLEMFKERGTIKISTLKDLLATDDTEGRQRRSFKATINAFTLSSERVSIQTSMFKFSEPTPNAIGVDVGGKLTFYNEIENAFIFCTSTKLNLDYWKTERAYEAYYTIINPKEFMKLLWRKLNKQFGLARPPIFGIVEYTPHKDETATMDVNSVTKPSITLHDLCFTKTENFVKETEYRIMFIPRNPQGITSQLLDCPELRKYCKTIQTQV